MRMELLPVVSPIKHQNRHNTHRTSLFLTKPLRASKCAVEDALTARRLCPNVLIAARATIASSQTSPSTSALMRTSMSMETSAIRLTLKSTHPNAPPTTIPCATSLTCGTTRMLSLARLLLAELSPSTTSKLNTSTVINAKPTLAPATVAVPPLLSAL